MEPQHPVGRKSRRAEGAAILALLDRAGFEPRRGRGNSCVSIGPRRRYAGRGNPHAWLKSGAECTIIHEIILGAPRFSPHRVLGLPRLLAPGFWLLAP